MSNPLYTYSAQIKPRAQIEAEIPRHLQGWWSDVCANRILNNLRDATEADLARCSLNEGASRNPDDYLCENIERGSLINRKAILWLRMELPVNYAGHGRVDPNHDVVPTLRMFDGLIMGKAADEIERLRGLLQVAGQKRQGEPFTRDDADIFADALMTDGWGSPERNSSDNLYQRLCTFLEVHAGIPDPGDTKAT